MSLMDETAQENVVRMVRQRAAEHAAKLEAEYRRWVDALRELGYNRPMQGKTVKEVLIDFAKWYGPHARGALTGHS